MDEGSALCPASSSADSGHKRQERVRKKFGGHIQRCDAPWREQRRVGEHYRRRVANTRARIETGEENCGQKL